MSGNSEVIIMSTELYIRIIAATFVLIGLVLGRWVNAWWYLLPAFVGFNLIRRP